MYNSNSMSLLKLMNLNFLMIIIITLLLPNVFRYKNSDDQKNIHGSYVHKVNDRVDEKKNILKQYENEM